MIKILKASAGSGKTYHLAGTYIRLLLAAEDRHAYRHILAVTFTNKATDEMKSRILKELDLLAREPEASSYFAEFSRDFGPAEALRARAGELLVDILHDYGAFSVSTIDRFFQRTLKAFAREIGLFSSYQVELDKASLVHESVDRILDALTEENPDLLRWLTDSVMDQLERDGKFRLEADLYEMAEALESEEFRQVAGRIGLDAGRAYAKDRLLAVRKGCRKLMQDFNDRVRETASQALEAARGAGVDPFETSRHFLSDLETKYLALAPKDAPPVPTPAWLDRARNPEKWFPKGKARLLPRVQPVLEGPLDAFCDLFDQPLKVRNTASILSKQIYSLGIAGELYREFDALVKEKNVMSLEDSNTILARIIAGSDAPFIYEKLGVRFEDFLLDEFQDTSSVQWENFRPLLAESDASGRESLIVGDVKQSIYRWRGSDWSLLDSGVKQDFPRADDSRALTENWRSCRAIVAFNNAFFAFAAERLDRQLGNGDGLISKIYADVRQTPRTKETAPGSVQVTFCEKEEELAAVLASVRKAREAGADYGHIAVLVRKNETGSEVAGHLVANGVPVLSDDSLRVKSSITVRRLTSLLASVENGADQISAYLAKSLGIGVPGRYHSLIDLAEELLRALKSRDGRLFEGEVLYIQSFMDELQDWVALHGNHLSGFLKSWDEADPKISSPGGMDAVRILTIHKAKGLEFPYVIFPFAETTILSREDTRWSRPELDGTPLADFADGAYRVSMSSKTLQTLFSKDYGRELQYQYIDNINTFYVAMTRAERVLHVIARTPSDKCVRACETGDGDFRFSDFSQLLYGFVHHCPWDPGAPFDFRTTGSRDRTEARDADYPSFPLNPGPGNESDDVRERGRLKFSADAVDFFREDALVRSPRLKGLVLHSILSWIVIPEDLDRAVEQAVGQGLCDARQAGRYRAFLSARIEAVRDRGWFPEDRRRVRNEWPVIDTDGREWRPDRVVFAPEGTVVVDYKFGEEEASHRRQVQRYVRLYEAMGRGPVRGFLWYLREDGPDRIEEVAAA